MATNQETTVSVETPVDENDDTKTFKNLFSDSTHQFLYATKLNEDGRDIHWGDKLVAILVLVVQCGLYIYLFQAASGDVGSDEVPVTMAHGACGEKNFENLKCDADDISSGPLSTSIILFLCFMAPDIGGALSLILKGSLMAKVTGVVLLAEVFMATLCCAMMAIVGGLSSGADAIMAAVGVAFIHDLDEKVRLVYSSVPKFKHLIILIVFTLAMGGICVGVSQVMAANAHEVGQSELNESDGCEWSEFSDECG